MESIPNDVREGIEAAITRGIQDEIKSTTSEKKHREEFFASLPSWMSKCHRNDYDYDTTYDIASATFALPGGEKISVKRAWGTNYSKPGEVDISMHFKYWMHSKSRWSNADTLDHAIFCATELTRQEMEEKAKAKLLLDAQEESA
jgi:hypothetical protein